MHYLRALSAIVSISICGSSSSFFVSEQNVRVGDTGPMDAKAHDERVQLIELVKRQVLIVLVPSFSFVYV